MSLSTAEAARRAGVSQRRIQKLAAEGRIAGARQTEGGGWILPDNFSITPSARRAGRQKETK